MNRQDGVILVTGSTGKVGGAVARQLLKRGKPVRALVHKVDQRSSALERAGAQIVVADLFDPQQVIGAMNGVVSAFFVPPVHQYMIQSAVVFAVAAKRANLGAVVVLSQWLASPAHPALLTRHHWLTDQMFAMLPEIEHITVNPGPFADSYLEPEVLRTVANLGVFPNPFGPGKDAPASSEDIAAVAVEALLHPERHAGRTYHPTGPVLLSAEEMALILGKVFNRKVKPVAVDSKSVNKSLRASGWQPFEHAITVDYAIESQGGDIRGLGAPTNHVLEVTGRVPEDFETTARRYSALPSVQASMANRFASISEFAKTILTPPTDLRRYKQSQNFPELGAMVYNFDSPNWIVEHKEIALKGVAPEWS